MTKGVSMHRTEDGAQRKSYWDGTHGRMLIKDVAFAERGTAVVSGGENGEAYVFDRFSAQQTATLCHKPIGGLVQIIAVRQLCHFAGFEIDLYQVHDSLSQDTTTIATGASAQMLPGSVCIWRKGDDTPIPAQRTLARSNAISSAMAVVLLSCVIVLVAAATYTIGRNPDLVSATCLLKSFLGADSQIHAGRAYDSLQVWNITSFGT